MVNCYDLARADGVWGNGEGTTPAPGYTLTTRSGIGPGQQGYLATGWKRTESCGSKRRVVRGGT
ncbi:uncharacterized protein SCHCODRAFT_02682594 [Schizophyllum commune H4-8]|uniref:uncharacterized protein n=1 Tax=Schizophyllum commune (strain H4-8 / FGSC 9210) TaxID=578458 RepID=UPI00215EC198|nr:uncharacterized protein SCHCODRAFT_02682594 [Schizophyllum commune H4-8]KAI5899609.1 hypothetical protein SCHCODRAFT_02682594 [Schizophyllum commune H4-8]